ncbi:unnamed protein product [Linum trigynum]|uniref:Uncharacterized protein n=1 Tax=Linum trigynum TaxID=586398 RepID=A0AAV2ERV3_9ROSI
MNDDKSLPPAPSPKHDFEDFPDVVSPSSIVVRRNPAAKTMNERRRSRATALANRGHGVRKKQYAFGGSRLASLPAVVPFGSSLATGGGRGGRGWELEGGSDG